MRNTVPKESHNPLPPHYRKDPEHFRVKVKSLKAVCGGHTLPSAKVPREEAGSANAAHLQGSGWPHPPRASSGQDVRGHLRKKEGVCLPWDPQIGS